MSSNIRIDKKCLFCKNKFIAKTLITKYCSHVCNRKHYKILEREKKISAVQVVPSSQTEILKRTQIDKEFLSMQETADMLGLHVRTIMNMVKQGRIKHTKFGRKILIKKTDLL
jgi:excisionase family DNA binding protein